jgi:glycosyltransferase involved in cell wall biosynthesis
MISFIVPAFNEAHELPRSLAAIHHAAQPFNQPFEVIVVNDGSTDRTRDIALQAGARVVDVQLRQISAVRNAGAREARGEWFFFIDADTQVTSAVLKAAWAALEVGAVGGGAWVTFAEPVSRFVKLSIFVFSVFYLRLCGWAAGCFIFARRDAFFAVGGFNENVYAGEEIGLSRALKQQGRFVILREAGRTSARKMRLHSPKSMIPFLFRFVRYGPAMLKQRKGLEWWYDGKRER